MSKVSVLIASELDKAKSRLRGAEANEDAQAVDQETGVIWGLEKALEIIGGN